MVADHAEKSVWRRGDGGLSKTTCHRIRRLPIDVEHSRVWRSVAGDFCGRFEPAILIANLATSFL